MRKALFGVFLLICMIACSMNAGQSLIGVDSSDEGGLTSKTAVIKYSTYKYGSKEYPVVAYVTDSSDKPSETNGWVHDGDVYVAWLQPSDEDAPSYGGLEISWSSAAVEGTNNVQKAKSLTAWKGNFAYDLGKEKDNHYGSNGWMFVNKKLSDDTAGKYDYRDAAWADAQSQKNKGAKKSKLEQRTSIEKASKLEHMVINVRAFDLKSAHNAQDFYYPYTTLCEVVEFVSAYEAFGYGYDVPDGNYFSPLGLKHKPILDLNKLKNKNKYAIGTVQMNESTQETVFAESKEDFLDKINEKTSKDASFNMNTEFFGQKFNFNFKDQFSSEHSTLKSNTEKQYFARYQGKVARMRQRIMDQYCSLEYLGDCLDDGFKRDINDSTKTPQYIFDTYGTHILLDVVLGGRCDLHISGKYDTTSTTESTSEVVSKMIVVYQKDSSSSNSLTTTITASDTYGRGWFYGGNPEMADPPEWNKTKLCFDGDVNKWSQSIVDGNSVLIDSPTCIANEDISTGVWNYANDPSRRQQLKKAYLSKCYGNYASLLSGINRTKDDDLYIKSFGFVSFYNPDYPLKTIAGESGWKKESGYWVSYGDYKWKDNFFISLKNPGKENQGFEDFPMETIRAAAVAKEQAKGNSVEPDQIHFFESKGAIAGSSNYLFKIVDARRTVYSDPLYNESYKLAADADPNLINSKRLDKSGRGTVENYSVRLGGGLRYNHIGTGKYDTGSKKIDTQFAKKDKWDRSAPEYDDVQGYVFHYPYYVTTKNAEEALTGIVSTDVSISSGKRASSDYNNAAYKNANLFGKDSNLSNVCHDYSPSAPSNFDELKKQDFANSWVVASDHVFNVYRPGLGRDDYGKGDLLENPVNWGVFREYYSGGNKSHDFYIDGYDYIKERAQEKATINTYSLADAGYVYDRVKHEFKHEDHVSVSNTLIPWSRFAWVNHKRYWKGIQFVGETYLNGYIVDYRSNFDQLKEGKLFNSMHPQSFVDACKKSKMAPIMVYTSNKVDEHGNTRELEKVKPIKEIDFFFCDNLDNPNANGAGLSDTAGVTWEMVEKPVGASEWIVTDKWNTKKRLNFYRAYNDALYNDINVAENVGKKNKNPQTREGDFTPISRRGSGLNTKVGHSLYQDNTGSIVYGDKEAVNYFTRTASNSRGTANSGDGAVVKKVSTQTKTVNETFTESYWFNFPKPAPTVWSEADAPGNYVDFEVRDLERYDIYIRFRR